MKKNHAHSYSFDRKSGYAGSRSIHILRFYEDYLKICIYKLTLDRVYFIMMNLERDECIQSI